MGKKIESEMAIKNINEKKTKESVVKQTKNFKDMARKDKDELLELIAKMLGLIE